MEKTGYFSFDANRAQAEAMRARSLFELEHHKLSRWPHCRFTCRGVGDLRSTVALQGAGMPSEDGDGFESGLVVDSALNIGFLYLDAYMPFKFFVSVVRWEIRRARRLALDGLIVVMPEVKGFPPPDIASREQMVQEWAESARGGAFEELGRAALEAHLRLAIVAPEDHIDRDLIGVKIAAVHGLIGDIVTTEQGALDWMKKATSQQATSP